MDGSTANRVLNKLNHWSSVGGLFFLLLLLATFMNEHVNAFRNIGLYGVVIMVLLHSATRKWRITVTDWYLIVLFVFSLLVLQGVMRNEYGAFNGLEHFRKTYFKGFVLAIGIPLFVNNYRAVSMAVISLFVSAIGVLSSEIYRYIVDENARFFYAGKAVRHSAHLIDFIDPIAVACTRHRTPIIRFSSIVLVVGFTILVIGTGTRGGWLALVAGFLTTYFLVNKNHDMVWTVAKSSVRVLVIVVGAYLLAPDGSMVKNKLEQGVESGARVEFIYPTYFNVIANGPLLGHGYSKHLEYKLRNIYGEDEGKFNKALGHGPHNQFLLYGIYFGIIGAVLYIIVVVWTLLRLIRRSIDEEDIGIRILSATGAGMVVAEYITRSMTDIVPGHWIGVPIGIALIKISGEKE